MSCPCTNHDYNVQVHIISHMSKCFVKREPYGIPYASGNTLLFEDADPFEMAGTRERVTPHDNHG